MVSAPALLLALALLLPTAAVPAAPAPAADAAAPATTGSEVDRDIMVDD